MRFLSRLFQILHVRLLPQPPPSIPASSFAASEEDEGHETLYSPDPTNPGRVRRLWRHLTQFPVRAAEAKPLEVPRKLPRNHPTVQVPTPTRRDPSGRLPTETGFVAVQVPTPSSGRLPAETGFVTAVDAPIIFAPTGAEPGAPSAVISEVTQKRKRDDE